MCPRASPRPAVADMVKSHTFCGRRYDIDILDGQILHGICTKRNPPGRSEIIIAPKINSQEGIITVVHEALHASRWRMQEKTVDRIATDLGRFLWRLGYRCPPKS